MIQEVRVALKPGIPDSKGEEVLYEVRHALGMENIERVKTTRVFRFEGISEEEARFLAENLLSESVFQEYRVNAPIIEGAAEIVEVAYRPGVMNPEAESLVKSARHLGVKGLLAADSSWEYGFYGRLSSADVEKVLKSLLVNPTVEYVVKEKPATLLIRGTAGRTKTIPIREMSDRELMELSADRLFLNLEEMKAIQDYFNRLGRDPTDCEIETIAQTWSEHCVHKTFKARIVAGGVEKEPFLTRIKKATAQCNHPLVLSAFIDNSGVMEFYEGMAVCGKVETHNSPSAIEPYGGAMTGSGGVFRDIAGTGRGAKVIASTDMFCFAPPDTPRHEIPAGCLHPHYLLRRVVAGVRDYGNRMGIPTNNGSVHFHPDFRAKPTVIVGAYGILPAALSQKGAPQPGDLVVVVGGRTGRDGIHGATFSSGEMTDRTIEVNASAVQIGHPIEEKRTFDAILAARDEGLIRAITDCGAGGFSSAVGEMGAEVGAHLELEKAPLKYSGLAPWEILLSESQERMVLAVAPEHVDRLMDICRLYNVEATVLGRFTGDRRFTATYDGEKVLDLDMDFLHSGLPQRVLKASWKKPSYDEPKSAFSGSWQELMEKVMGHLNVCSKEPIVRMYDHGVQGTCALPPYGGVEHDGPGDGVVLAPILGKPYGVIIAHGLNPVLNLIDPYYGSLWAAAEAVSNAVACGANPDEMVLIDNFIWPYPDEESLGALDMAVDACVDFVKETGMPFISGKDSLSSTYRGRDGTVIKIPPVLCVSAFGRIPDVTKTASSDFKAAGNRIVLVGYRNAQEMGGTVYYELLGAVGSNLPKINPRLLKEVLLAVHRAINSQSVLACHDISEGGLAAALAEMCFGGGLGAEIELPPDVPPENFLFNETAGCFLIELPGSTDPFALFNGVPWQEIGRTKAGFTLVFHSKGGQDFTVDLKSLKRAWQRPMKEVFGF